jgi:hypothetical protein
VAALVGWAVLLAYFAGCAKGPYSLPADWPMPQLTLPPNSTIAVRPVAMHKLSPSWPDEDWLIYFDCPSTLQTVVDHVEQCLKPLNYSEFYLDNPRIGNTRDAMRQYYSPDRLTKVVVERGTKGAGIPQKFASDYTLSITISTSPDPVLKHAGTTSSTGVKTVLEPIQ